MKKTIMTLAFIATTLGSVFAQDSKKVNAQYQGYDGSVYSFIDENNDYYDFERCPATLVKSFDLEGESHFDDYFMVTYVIKKNEGGDVYYEIQKLEQIESEE